MVVCAVVCHIIIVVIHRYPRHVSYSRIRRPVSSTNGNDPTATCSRRQLARHSQASVNQFMHRIIISRPTCTFAMEKKGSAQMPHNKRDPKLEV